MTTLHTIARDKKTDMHANLQSNSMHFDSHALCKRQANPEPFSGIKVARALGDILFKTVAADLQPPVPMSAKKNQRKPTAGPLMGKSNREQTRERHTHTHTRERERERERERQAQTHLTHKHTPFHINKEKSPFSYKHVCR